MNLFKLFIRLGRFFIAIVLLISCFYSMSDLFKDKSSINTVSQYTSEWSLKFDKMDLSLAYNDSTLTFRIDV